MRFSFAYKHNQVLLLMFSIALFLRLTTLFLLKSWLFPKFYEYGILAQNILIGKGYSLPFVEPEIVVGKPFYSWMPPLYPFVVALFLWIFKNPYFWLLICQCLISALTCLCIYLIASRVFGYRIGILAGFITAIFPLFVLIPTKVLPSTLDIFLFSVFMIFLMKAKEEKGFSYGVMAGVSFGLFSLSQPQMLGFFPFIIVWLYLNKTKRIWIKVLLIGLFTLITISPWTVRNYLVHNKFVFISTNGGYNLWIGNNPAATGIAMRGSLEILPSELKKSIRTLSETEFDSRLFWAGIDYIKNNPSRYIELSAKKLFFFWFRPDLGLEKHDRRTVFLSLYVIQNLFLILMSIFGIFLARKHWRMFSLVYLFMGYYSLIYMNFFFLSRYRWIVDPFLIILMSIFVNHLIEKFSIFLLIKRWRSKISQ